MSRTQLHLIVGRRQQKDSIWAEESKPLALYARLAVIQLLVISTMQSGILAFSWQGYSWYYDYDHRTAAVAFGLSLGVLVFSVALLVIPVPIVKTIIRALTGLGATLCLAAGIILPINVSFSNGVYGVLSAVASICNIMAGIILIVLAFAAFARLNIIVKWDTAPAVGYVQIRQAGDDETSVLVSDRARGIASDEERGEASMDTTRDLRGSMDSYQDEGASLLP